MHGYVQRCSLGDAGDTLSCTTRQTKPETDSAGTNALGPLRALQCDDRHEKCQEWAKAGECKRNPG